MPPSATLLSFTAQMQDMDALFMTLGTVDILAGALLFADPSGVIKFVAAVMLTKGAVTVMKAF